MNDKQIAWTLEKCNILIKMVPSFPLSDEVVEQLNAAVKEYYKLSKYNNEVKEWLIDTYNEIDKMDRLFRTHRGINNG